MGQSAAKYKTVNIPPPGPRDPISDSIRDGEPAATKFTEAKLQRIVARQKQIRKLPVDVTPAVAVVGGGLPGLLVARDLALRGFSVTVFDQCGEPAQGSSRLALGMWSEHHPLTTAPWSIRLPRTMIGGLFSKSEVVSWDATWSAATRWPFVRWCLQRLRTTRADDVLVLDSLNGMKRRNAEVMQQLLADHPELAETVISTHAVQRQADVVSHPDEATGAPEASEGFKEGPPEVQPSLTSVPVEDNVTVVDAPRFVDTLAELLRDEYGVRIELHRKMTKLQFRLAYDREDVHHGIFKYAPPAATEDEEAPDPVIEGRRFDLFVLAAGKNTMDAAWTPYLAPVLPVRGYGMDIPPSHPLAASFKQPSGCAGPKGLIQWGPVRDPTGATTDTWTRITGLWSLKRLASEPPASWGYQYLLSQAAASCGVDHANAPHIDLPGKHADWATDDKFDGIRTFTYERGFSADGLPIVSTLGSAENAFVLSGFGDNVFSLAAGAADLLGRMVVRDAPRDESNVFTMWHYKSTKPIEAQGVEWNWQDKLMTREIKWAKSLSGNTTVEPIVRVVFQMFRVRDALPPPEETLAEIGPEAPFERRMRIKELRRRQAAEAAGTDAAPPAPGGSSDQKA